MMKSNDSEASKNEIRNKYGDIRNDLESEKWFLDMLRDTDKPSPEVVLRYKTDSSKESTEWLKELFSFDSSTTPSFIPQEKEEEDDV